MTNHPSEKKVATSSGFWNVDGNTFSLISLSVVKSMLSLPKSKRKQGARRGGREALNRSDSSRHIIISSRLISWGEIENPAVAKLPDEKI